MKTPSCTLMKNCVPAVIAVTAILSALPSGSAGALPLSNLTNFDGFSVSHPYVTEVVVRRSRTTVIGPRGGVARRTTTVVRRPVARWARPGHYWWRPGGAMAAGAAIGFVTAATAVAWAGAAPAPNMCWYYTDPNQTKGFWDQCP